MMNAPRHTGEDEVQRALALTERGMGAIQEMLAVLRDSDREVAGLIERVRHLELLVWSDVLTGLLNRRGMEEEIAREEARSRRYGTPVAVILIEVLGLRGIAERYGVPAGDTMLRAVGAAIRTGARGSDIVARYREDAFAAILPGAEIEGAQIFLQRVATAAQFVRLPGGAIVPIQITAGLATREEAGSLQAARELAAERLITNRQVYTPNFSAPPEADPS